MDKRLGLLRAMQDFIFAVLGLRACRAFEDFSLPVSLGAGFVTLGGASYASVGVLRPLEVAVSSQVLLELSTPHALVTAADDLIVAEFALPTPSELQSERKWVQELQRGREAGREAETRMDTEKIIWLGDFNFEPPSTRAQRDPRKLYREAWDETLLGSDMWLMNPCLTK